MSHGSFHFFYERGYIPITYIKRYAKPVLCFFLIFIIVLSSFAVGTAPKIQAIAGIDDLYMTLYSYMMGAAAAGGGAALGANDSFEYSAKADDFDFSSRRDATTAYPKANRYQYEDAEYYHKIALSTLPDRDNYYYDWVKVFDAISYHNNLRLEHWQDNHKYVEWIWDLLDGKFTLTQMIEMGFVKKVTLTDNNTYWVTNIGYKNSDFVENLKDQQERAKTLKQPGYSVRDDIISRVQSYDAKVWQSAVSLGSGETSSALCLTRIKSTGALFFEFFYGHMRLALTSADIVTDSFGNRFQPFFMWGGGQWRLDTNFNVTYAMSYKQTDKLYYPLDDDTVAYENNGSSVIRYLLYSDDTGGTALDYNVPVTYPTLTYSESYDLSYYCKDRITELEQNPDDVTTVVYAPPIYDKDGTLVQAPTYVYPVTDDMVTDNILTGDGVVDNPASGTDSGILGWLQSLWDWLTGIFWDAINAIRDAVSAIGSWCQNFWSSLTDTLAGLFVPREDYWDDKPDPGKIILKRLVFIEQLKRITGSIQGMKPEPLKLSFQWYDIDNILTYPNQHKLRTYTVDFSWYDNYKDYVRGGLSVLFILLAVLGCIRIICGIFGVGLSNSSGFNIGNGGSSSSKEIVISGDRGIIP